ncbi:MAG: hypothetical protein FJX77_12655, partial [Armatimonadetes bacterium]|nr:hypothetical protein [Armatimonadota bacterium]
MQREEYSRRDLLVGGVAGLGAAVGLGVSRPAEAVQTAPKVEGNLAWYNVEAWGVEGRGWTDTARYFDRFPALAEKTIPGSVWNLSRHSAGMLVRFETSAGEIHARYTLRSPNLALPHMPATGVSGLDLYGRDRRGRDRWLGVVLPGAQRVQARLAGGLDAVSDEGGRTYTIYLPLYNGLDELEIGVPREARFRGLAPRRDKPLVFYGTSIMHGACASRTGMSITGILGRRFRKPVINLGFSGNGRMDTGVVSLLAELDPAVYAIDCLPNMTPEMVAERTEPLVRALRAARPDTPILLVEDRTFTNSPFLEGTRRSHTARRAAFRRAYDQLIGSGVKGLAYLPGDRILGEDGEGATDGSHPNDLGMVRYADAYEPALRRL